MLHAVGIMFTVVPRMSKDLVFTRERKTNSSYKIRYITKNKSRILAQLLTQKKITEHTQKLPHISH